MSLLAPVLGLAALAVLALNACGTSTPSGACGTFEGCGGDLAGSWQVKQTCLAGDFLAEGCKEAAIDPSGIKSEGTSTFTAATSTYSVAFTQQGSVLVTFPAVCLDSGDAGAVDCKQVEARLTPEITGANAPFSTVTCAAASGGGCACTQTLKPTMETDSGTYKVAGNLVMLTPTGGKEETWEYCATTSELRIGVPGTPADGGARTNVAGTILFSRK